MYIGTIENTTQEHTPTGRCSTFVIAKFNLSGGVANKATVNIRSVKLVPPPPPPLPHAKPITTVLPQVILPPRPLPVAAVELVPTIENVSQDSGGVVAVADEPSATEPPPPAAPPPTPPMPLILPLLPHDLLKIDGETADTDHEDECIHCHGTTWMAADVKAKKDVYGAVYQSQWIILLQYGIHLQQGVYKVIL